MSVNEAISGINENDAKALKRDIKAALTTAKILLAAYASKLPAEQAESAEADYEAIRDIIRGLES